MAKMTSSIKLLSEVGLFEGLARKDLQLIEASSKVVTFAPGRVIVEEGSAGVAFHLILDGKAKVSVKGRVRAKLGPGDYFGEISLIDRGVRSATVIADSEVQTLTLASWNFLQIVDSAPSIGRKLLAGMCKRIRDTEKSSLRH